MDNNWIIDNLNYAFTLWNDKLTEMWSLLTQSPQSFKGGTIWQTIQTVNGAMQGVGYGLLVLFLAIGIFRSGVGFRDFRRPEYVLRHFLYFVMAKLAVTYGIDLMMDIFAVCAGIISAAAGSVGGIEGAALALPGEIVTAIEGGLSCQHPPLAGDAAGVSADHGAGLFDDPHGVRTVFQALLIRRAVAGGPGVLCG